MIGRIEDEAQALVDAPELQRYAAMSRAELTEAYSEMLADANAVVKRLETNDLSRPLDWLDRAMDGVMVAAKGEG